MVQMLLLSEQFIPQLYPFVTGQNRNWKMDHYLYNDHFFHHLSNNIFLSHPQFTPAACTGTSPPNNHKFHNLSFGVERFSFFIHTQLIEWFTVFNFVQIYRFHNQKRTLNGTGYNFIVCCIDGWPKCWYHIFWSIVRLTYWNINEKIYSNGIETVFFSRTQFRVCAQMSETWTAAEALKNRSIYPLASTIPDLPVQRMQWRIRWVCFCSFD